MGVKIPKPSEINTEQYFMASFGTSESEWSANMLVRYAQKKETESGSDLWPDFTQADIKSALGYEKDFPFNGLLGKYIEEKGGVYSYTLSFIGICYDKFAKA